MSHASTRVAAQMSEAIRRHSATLERAFPAARRGDRRAVHRLRVTSRRLREIAAVATAPSRDREALLSELRDLTRALGPLREVAVSRKVLAAVAPARRWARQAVSAIDRGLGAKHEACLAEVVTALDAIDRRRLRDRVEALAVKVQSEGGAAVGARLAGRIVGRAKAFEGSIAAAGTVYAAAPLHAVRIAGKKLRYALELAGEAEAAARGRLRRLQRLLGDWHDLQVLQLEVKSLEARQSGRRSSRALHAIDGDLEAACRADHARMIKVFPAMRELARGIVSQAPRRIAPRSMSRPVRAGHLGDGRRGARAAS